MKNKHDDLLNKYVDNELNKNEIKQVENLVNTDEEFKLNLITHKYVHESLYDIPLKSASTRVTELIMNKIVSKLSDKYEKNYFFRIVFTVLSLVMVTVLFMFFFYASNLELAKGIYNVKNTASQFFNPLVVNIFNLISTDIFRVVSGLVGLIILLGFYLYYNSFKMFKEKLKQL